MAHSTRSGMARTMSGLVLASVLVLQAAGCAVLERRGPPGEDARRGVARFMKATIAREYESAFASIEIEAMVNSGQPQGPLYRSLSPQHQEQYRRELISGIHAFLFRDPLPGQAIYTIEVPDPAQPVVEVAGSPGRRLRFTVRTTPDGCRITGIAKAAGGAR